MLDKISPLNATSLVSSTSNFQTPVPEIPLGEVELSSEPEVQRATVLPSPEEIAKGDDGRPNSPSLPQEASDWLSVSFFGFLFICTIICLTYVLRGFLADFIIAFILVGLLQRPYQTLLPVMGRRAWLASATITSLALVIILVPLLSLAYQIGVEGARVFASLDELSEQSLKVTDDVALVLKEMGLRISSAELVKHARDMADDFGNSLLSTGGGLLGGMISLFIHLGTILIVLFYVLVDGKRLRDFFFDLSPLPDDEDALLVEAFRKVAKGVVVGQVLGSALQGLLGGLSFWAVGLPSPVLWGAFMGVLAFLPLVGVSAVALPAAIYLYATGKPMLALFFLIFNLVQGAIVENIVKTRLIGSAMKMHDLLVFLTVIGGIATFGLMGIVYGPLIGTLFLTLYELYRQVYRPRIALRLSGGTGPGTLGRFSSKSFPPMRAQSVASVVKREP